MHLVKLHSPIHVHVAVQTSSVYHSVKLLHFEEIDVIIRLRAGRSSFRIPAGVRKLYLLRKVRIGSEVQPASYSVGTGGGGVIFWGVKWPRREVDHTTI